ncbi:hypothetical protein WICPIJ_009426 [Wickerhamomyces pijperi]|uniref:Uncharacterized protein n=1 Tax=Wickerhamomyces pijperi TaxID=599730 RepID=A0A9P8PN33_WICPI|nr:hypothetical protein WICPIJ_009426 [Wickerhamomyces pijperi]
MKLSGDSQQVPSLIQGFKDGSVFVGTLLDESLLELLQELQGQLVFIGQGFFTDNGLHGSSVTANGVLGVKLVGHITVVLTCHTFTDGGLHQSGKRRKNVDWRGQSWSDDSFDGWIVGQVQEQRGSLQGPILFEITLEETGSLQVDTHGSEDNGEVLLVAIMDVLGWSNQPGLSTDLGGNFVVWQTGSGENWDLLTSGNGVHGVDGGDTSGDHFFRVDTSKWVDWGTVDVQVVFGKDLRPLVDWSTGTVKHSPQGVFGDWNLQVLTGELNTGLLNIDTGGTFENLHNGTGPSHFQHLPSTNGAVWQGQVDDFVETWELDVF